jgi:hypothetical protein
MPFQFPSNMKNISIIDVMFLIGLSSILVRRKQEQKKSTTQTSKLKMKHPFNSSLRARLNDSVAITTWLSVFSKFCNCKSKHTIQLSLW